MTAPTPGDLEKAREIVTGVALYSTNMIVALPRPHRHHHLFSLSALLRIEIEPCVQGFTTSRNRFVTRDVAMSIVRDSGQPFRSEPSKHATELFSEDLW